MAAPTSLNLHHLDAPSWSCAVKCIGFANRPTGSPVSEASVVCDPMRVWTGGPRVKIIPVKLSMKIFEVVLFYSTLEVVAVSRAFELLE